MPGNQALNANANAGPQADLAISVRASDWYFTVCAIMGVSTLAIAFLSYRKPRTHRLFHNITALITLVACIAYFTMGAGLGQTPVVTEFPSRFNLPPGGTREIFYVRYIDWFVTTPLLLLDLALTAGLPLSSILTIIVADEIMVVTGLVGALVPSAYKWGFWTFGTVAFLYVVWALAVDGRQSARALGPAVSRVYVRCGLLTLFLWFLYPIAWGLSEGGNVIHPDSEAVFYGVLDVFAKPVFGALLLWGHRHIDPADLGLDTRERGPLHKGAAVPGRVGPADRARNDSGTTAHEPMA